MAARKISPEIQMMFEKYTVGNARRLNRPEAIKLLHEQFDISEKQATDFFEHFDADKNGFLSMWEFSHFYKNIGNRAREIVAKFEELDTDGNGELDRDEVRAGLAAMKTADDQTLNNKEIEFFLNTSIGESASLNVGQFAELMARLRIYKRPSK